ncbi:hypothetical protein [Flavobacterium collinsii]|uniref:Uncharacterized protein n=1 Tax=Flavobacterium collinsii TaxID=1114861 RepID=A0A9W4TIQ9_9FLAO|nr:hypothetical protein [Flavobacterium collinsii]CAI2767642.1 conserved protein of unknown function [Flavobacterium collinsii]
MTTIASFVSISDAKKKTLSMISDSRISWTTDEKPDIVVNKYDFSQKIFKIEDTLDIFGYCGDSLFCLSNISQIISYLRSSVDYREADAIEKRRNIIYSLIEDSINNYPGHEIRQSFRVYWNSIFGEELYSFKFFYKKNTGKFDVTQLEIPEKTGLVFKDGSGETFYGNELSTYYPSSEPTSRFFFKALVDVIEKEHDSKTGGPPQMACLNHFKKSITSVSILYKSKYYLNGVHDIYSSNGENVEFRDTDFNFLTPEGKTRNNYTGSFPKK